MIGIIKQLRTIQQRATDLLEHYFPTRDDDNILLINAWLQELSGEKIQHFEDKEQEKKYLEGLKQTGIAVAKNTTVYAFFTALAGNQFSSPHAWRRERQILQKKHEHLRGAKYEEHQRHAKEDVRETIVHS